MVTNSGVESVLDFFKDGEHVYGERLGLMTQAGQVVTERLVNLRSFMHHVPAVQPHRMHGELTVKPEAPADDGQAPPHKIWDNEILSGEVVITLLPQQPLPGLEKQLIPLDLLPAPVEVLPIQPASPPSSQPSLF